MNLTKQEKTVMKLLCEGARFKAIAAELNISHSRVVHRIKDARKKIRAKNSYHACFLIGANRGLIE